MNKTEELKKIRDEIWELEESPLYQYRVQNKYYPVIGEGDHDAEIMFIGEAPGQTEAKTGRPFCGAAGKLLDEFLASAGINRSDVYITNIVKDRPPENRDPLPEEIVFYSPFLERQINIIQPAIIVTLGRFSMRFIMEKFDLGDAIKSISQIHGQAFEARAPYGQIKIITMYHPAAGIYHGETKKELFADFQILKDIILKDFKRY